MLSCSWQEDIIAKINKSVYPDSMTRKPLSTKIENDLQKEIKKLAIDLERPLNDLLEEAIRDFLEKHKAKKNLAPQG